MNFQDRKSSLLKSERFEKTFPLRFQDQKRNIQSWYELYERLDLFHKRTKRPKSTKVYRNSNRNIKLRFKICHFQNQDPRQDL